MTNPTIEERVIREFEKKFVQKYQSGAYVEVMKPAIDIKQFILKALSLQREETKEVIEEEMIVYCDGAKEHYGCSCKPVNQALKDVLSKLKL